MIQYGYVLYIYMYIYIIHTLIYTYLYMYLCLYIYIHSIYIVFFMVWTVQSPSQVVGLWGGALLAAPKSEAPEALFLGRWYGMTWGFPWGTQIAGWFIVENPTKHGFFIWMMTGGTPISGNLYLGWYPYDFGRFPRTHPFWSILCILDASAAGRIMRRWPSMDGIPSGKLT